MIIGRNFEQKRLEELYHSDEAEFIAIYGRRRVGKTFLITEFFRNKGFFFEVTGQFRAPLAEQLENFYKSFCLGFSLKSSNQKPKTWNKAFEILREQLEQRNKNEKIILFFDELPWLAARKSGFIGALEYFWNRWASRQKNCKVIVCGSAASWIIQNIVNAKGGLHNRLTASIRLLPFSLSETRNFLHHRKIRLNDRQILDLYMVLGGIPHYLKQVRRGLSATQNINDLCFRKDGTLVTEFNRLFDSLFENSTDYKKIIVALARSRNGLNREHLLRTINAKPGGTLNRILTSLEEAGFIMALKPFGKKNRDTIFKLCDEYSRFYISWIRPLGRSLLNDPYSEYWQKQSTGQRWKVWAGLAFEDVCFKHIYAIKKALGISGVITKESSWFQKGSSKGSGFQIDLIIDRNDACITLCEIKFHEGPFGITKQYANALQQKKQLFKQTTGTRKAVFISMITAEGIRQNEYSTGLVDSEVKLADLFV